MSTKKITALTELAAAAAAADMIPIVDVSDTTDAATGTTKKITALNVGKGIGIGAGNTTAEPVKIDTSNARLGVGTDAPSQLVHINNSSGSATVMIETPNNGSDATLSMKSSDNQWNINSLEGGDLSIYDAGTAERMRIDTDGNVLIGGTATATSSTNNLHLFNGTAPAASVANGIVLYAEDATGSSELKVRDEAGNIATLSPHNFDLLGDRSEDMAWSYSCKNAFVGKEIAVDMTKVIRALEKLTGESYIKIRDIADSEKLDWVTEEKRKETERKTEIAKAKTKDDVEEPATYSKKSKPAWIK